MRQQSIDIGGIPAVLYGEPSKRVYLYAHGKMACKECAEGFARIADGKGYQVLSFDLPGHGERKAQNERCDVWNGTRDLRAVADYAAPRWDRLDLFACSIGAYFALNAYQALPLGKCLFQSPIVDMPYLIGRMLEWFDITPQRLEAEREIDTPIDLMTWDYYRYALEHPVTDWRHPTSILYGALDDLQSRDVMQAFADRFGCALTVSERSKHPFMEDADAAIVARWMEQSV